MFIGDVFFPIFCVGCNYLGVYLCPRCEKLLHPVVNDTCLYCAKRSPSGITHPLCQRRYGLDGAMSIYYYNPLMKKIMKEIKYRLARKVMSDLWNAVKPQYLYKLSFFSTQVRPDSIEPMPLHPARQRARGFNQAEIITTFFKHFLESPRSNFLVRTKVTKPQAQVKAGERRKNVRGVFGFRAGGKIAPTVLLIDDVMTTGYTLFEAAKVLKKAGALRVYALTFAKG